LDAGTQLALVGVVAAVGVRRVVATAAAGCCAVHAKEVAVRLVQQLAAALEAEGSALAVGVAAEQAATAAGFVEVILGLHVLVVRVVVTQPEHHAPTGQVEEAQDAGSEELAAQQLVDGGPRRVQRTVERLADQPAAELVPLHAHEANRAALVRPARCVEKEAEEPVQLSALSVRKANASRASGPDIGLQRAASGIDEVVVKL
jgi:hypothetical protein